MNEEPTLVRRAGRTGLLFLASVVLYLSGRFLWPSIPEVTKDLLLALCAVTGVHLLERAWLWRDIAQWNRGSLEGVFKDASELLRSAGSCGLTKIYRSRDDAHKDAVEAIGASRDRIWVLGVSLSEKVRLDELIPVLHAKLKARCDVRILLMNALRSPALFRTFLESPADEVMRIMSTDRTMPPARDPYFRQRLYRDFDYALSILQAHPIVGRAVRFYARDASCWLVIADKAAYYQPYTFGRPGNLPADNLCIGGYMPAFRFEGRRDAAGPFEILEDHFHKLWSTSGFDLFHMSAARADRETMLRRIFTLRRPWLESVSGVLYAARDGASAHLEGDRRQFTRLPCEGTVGLAIDWEESGTTRQVGATVVECSRGGMSAQLGGGLEPPADQIVTVEVKEMVDSPGVRYMIDELVEASGGSFRVKPRGSEGSGVLRLQVAEPWLAGQVHRIP